MGTGYRVLLRVQLEDRIATPAARDCVNTSQSASRTAEGIKICTRWFYIYVVVVKTTPPITFVTPSEHSVFHVLVSCYAEPLTTCI